MKEAGHSFLARIGKKRLRPGGKKATEWLLTKADIKAQSQVLEVACNMGTSSIELATKYGCHITACDLDPQALKRAKENAHAAGLSEKISFFEANAVNLPFADNSFDIVLNEAMLTMLSPQDKKKAVSSYLRVLRPGGVLLTHDVALSCGAEQENIIRQELSHAINSPVLPLSGAKWISLFQSAGFSEIESITGTMTLMSPYGMIYDEGVVNALRIVINGLFGKNRPIFFAMSKVFAKWKKELGFIAILSRKA